MTSVKLRIDNQIDIAEELRIFNNIVRLSYNRFHDGFNEKDIRAYLKPMFPEVGSWFI